MDAGVRPGRGFFYRNQKRTARFHAAPAVLAEPRGAAVRRDRFLRTMFTKGGFVVEIAEIPYAVRYALYALSQCVTAHAYWQ